MKNIALTILLCLGLHLAYAQHEPDSTIVLEAIVHNSNTDAGKFVIKLFEGNEMIERVKPYKRNNQFLVYLMPGKRYTLEVQQSKHHSKLISIDGTDIADGYGKIYYDFDVYLLPKKSLTGVDKSLLDFPYALMYYDQMTGNFNYSGPYTQQMNKDYMNLLGEAKQKK